MAVLDVLGRAGKEQRGMEQENEREKNRGEFVRKEGVVVERCRNEADEVVASDVRTESRAGDAEERHNTRAAIFQ